jgi:hypothetical protein
MVKTCIWQPKQILQRVCSRANATRSSSKLVSLSIPNHRKQCTFGAMLLRCPMRMYCTPILKAVWQKWPTLTNLHQKAQMANALNMIFYSIM